MDGRKRIGLLLILSCVTRTLSAQEFPENGISVHVSYALKVPLCLSYERYFNNMDAAEYKHVVLGLIFLKYGVAPIWWTCLN